MTDDQEARHERHVATIAKASAQIARRFAREGVTPEMVIEGLQKGAAMVAVTAGLNLPETAQLFRDFADALDVAEGEADPTRPTVQ